MEINKTCETCARQDDEFICPECLMVNDHGSNNWIPSESATLKLNEWKRHKSECKTLWHLCCAIAEICTAPTDMVVDNLTGWLWDEEEAGEIKSNNSEVDK